LRFFEGGIYVSLFFGSIMNKFYRNLIITVVSTALVIYIIYHSIGSGAYLAMSALALSSFLIGYLEPKRGWILALLQVTILLCVYFLNIIEPISRDLAMFATFSGCAISLIFSFVFGKLVHFYRSE